MPWTLSGFGEARRQCVPFRSASPGLHKRELEGGFVPAFPHRAAAALLLRALRRPGRRVAQGSVVVLEEAIIDIHLFGFRQACLPWLALVLAVTILVTVVRRALLPMGSRLIHIAPPLAHVLRLRAVHYESLQVICAFVIPAALQLAITLGLNLIIDKRAPALA